MKKALWAWILILLFNHCTSSGDKEDVSISSEGFHFVPGTGKSNYPISLIIKDSVYQLYYKRSSKEWGIAISQNLIHWVDTGAFEIPDNAQGDVVYDAFNTSGLGTVYIFFYSQDERLMARYSSNSKDWQNFEINLPNGVSGNPKISWDKKNVQWVMTLSNKNLIHLLTSENLADWKKVSEITSDINCQNANLFSLDNQWVIFLNGESPAYMIGDFDGQSFNFENATEVHWSDETLFTASTSLKESTYLVSNIGSKVFATPKKLSLDDQGKLTLMPIEEALVSQSITKRRGRLSSLRGDKSSWFHLEIDSVSTGFELIISNIQGELTSVSFDLEANSIFIDKGKSSNARKSNDETFRLNISPGQVSVDLIIDYQSLEIFVNNGSTVVMTEVYPVFIYDQLKLKVDREPYDARAIVYSISDQPLQ